MIPINIYALSAIAAYIATAIAKGHGYITIDSSDQKQQSLEDLLAADASCSKTLVSVGAAANGETWAVVCPERTCQSLSLMCLVSSRNFGVPPLSYSCCFALRLARSWSRLGPKLRAK